MYCLNYDYNKYFGLLKSQSGDIKFHLDSPKGYSRKQISAQTACNTAYYNKKAFQKA